jgi:hypothetical protein
MINVSTEIAIALCSLIVVVLGGLLAVIGYFLSLLHTDFRRLSNSVIALAQSVAVNEEKGKNGYREITMRVDVHDERLERIEDKFFKQTTV